MTVGTVVTVVEGVMVLVAVVGSMMVLMPVSAVTVVVIPSVLGAGVSLLVVGVLPVVGTPLVYTVLPTLTLTKLTSEWVYVSVQSGGALSV